MGVISRCDNTLPTTPVKNNVLLLFSVLKQFFSSKFKGFFPDLFLLVEGNIEPILCRKQRLFGQDKMSGKHGE